MRLDMHKFMRDGNASAWMAAAAVLTAGLVWTARSAAMAPARVQALRARAAAWGRLRAVEAEQQAARRRLAALQELPRPARPAPLTQLTEEFTPDARPDILDRGALALADGWRVRRVEIQYGEVALEDVGALLNAAAGRRPPWTLRACKIEASTLRVGCGRVTLNLESLERD